MIRLMLISAAAVLVIAYVAVYGGLRIVSGWNPGLIGFCGGVNLVACWVAFVPIAWARQRQSAYLPQAILAATVIRLLLVASVTMATLFIGTWPTMPLSIWIVVFYLVLLVVETSLAVGMLNATPESKNGTSP